MSEASEVQLIAAWVRHNSLVRGSVTAEQAASIDWIAMVARSKLFGGSCRDSVDIEEAKTWHDQMIEET